MPTQPRQPSIAGGRSLEHEITQAPYADTVRRQGQAKETACARGAGAERGACRQSSGCPGSDQHPVVPRAYRPDTAGWGPGGLRPTGLSRAQAAELATVTGCRALAVGPASLPPAIGWGNELDQRLPRDILNACRRRANEAPLNRIDVAHLERAASPWGAERMAGAPARGGSLPPALTRGSLDFHV